MNVSLSLSKAALRRVSKINPFLSSLRQAQYDKTIRQAQCDSKQANKPLFYFMR
jgi:hypothetical protein